MYILKFVPGSKCSASDGNYHGPFLRGVEARPGQCGSVGWSIIPQSKGCGFDPWSEYVGSLVWLRVGGNQSMFLSLKAVKPWLV